MASIFPEKTRHDATAITGGQCGHFLLLDEKKPEAVIEQGAGVTAKTKKTQKLSHEFLFMIIITYPCSFVGRLWNV